MAANSPRWSSAIALVFALVAGGAAAPLFEQKKLTPSSITGGYGRSVSVSSDTAIAGTFGSGSIGGAGVTVGVAGHVAELARLRSYRYVRQVCPAFPVMDSHRTTTPWGIAA